MLVIYISLIYKRMYILIILRGEGMRKLVQIISAAILSVAFIGSVAGAQSSAPCDGTITISGTGPGSNNTVTCTNITTVVITCVNNVNIATINTQAGESGTATVTGNGLGGNATSGTAINTNDSRVDASASCAAVASPSPSVTPVTPGSGSATPTAVKPAVLPNTAGASAETIVVASILAAAGIVVASRVAVAAYRHFGTK